MAAQTWNAELYRKNAAFVPALGTEVLALLQPRPGERVLDLGCGDGVLTSELLRAGCDVIGIDSSKELVAAAQQRGLDARVMSADLLPFEAEFDAVFSNAVLHWVKNARAAAAGCFRALKPGGRFVGEFGGAGNVAHICDALIAVLNDRGVDGARFSPWYFPSVAEYRRVLEDAGFVVEQIELFDRPTALPGDVVGWLETMANPFANALPASERAGYFADVRAKLVPSLQRGDGSWWADYVRLRFRAHRRA